MADNKSVEDSTATGGKIDSQDNARVAIASKLDGARGPRRDAERAWADSVPVLDLCRPGQRQIAWTRGAFRYCFELGSVL